MTVRRFTLGNGLTNLSQARQPSGSALTSPPPRDGEVIRTALPDDFGGIQFEIGRMIEYVHEAAKDPVVQKQADEIAGSAGLSGFSSDAIDRLAATEAWCRDHYVYVNDPPNIEVIQTPRRMIKQTLVPSAVLRSILDPHYEALGSALGPVVDSYELSGLCAGDCDEGSTLILSLLAGDPEMRPLRFRFGGNKGSLYHVWGLAGVNGQLIDSDLTEPSFTLGDFSKFDHYEETEVPL